jgi:hypothetical protein
LRGLGARSRRARWIAASRFLGPGFVALVQEIEEEARIRRETTGIKPPGVVAILAQDPTRRPKELKKSPAPFVHAATKAVRRELWEAYAIFVAAYRDVAEKLRAGGPDPPRFPAGCFQPALPFVGA